MFIRPTLTQIASRAIAVAASLVLGLSASAQADTVPVPGSGAARTVEIVDQPNGTATSNRAIRGLDESQLELYSLPFIPAANSEVLTATDAFGALVRVLPRGPIGSRPFLAVAAPLRQDATGGVGAVMLYDCDTGALLRTLVAPAGTRSGLDIGVIADQSGDSISEIVIAGAKQTNATQWSPQTLVYDGASGELLAIRQQSISFLQTYASGGQAVLLMGDLNDSGAIDTYDLIELASHILNGSTTCTRCDLNRDGVLDQADFVIATNQYLEGRRSIAFAGSSGSQDNQWDVARTVWAGVHSDSLAGDDGPSSSPLQTGNTETGKWAPCDVVGERADMCVIWLTVGDVLPVPGVDGCCAYRLEGTAGILEPASGGYTAVGPGTTTIILECNCEDIVTCSACTVIIKPIPVTPPPCAPTVEILCCDPNLPLRVPTESRFTLQAKGTPPGGRYSWTIVDSTGLRIDAARSQLGNWPTASIVTRELTGEVLVLVEYFYQQCSVSTSCLVLIVTDTDKDGLDDHIEKDLGTDPEQADSDNDGWGDGCETRLQSDPLSADSIPASAAYDSDRDGLSDAEELCRWGTDPWSADTDGDTVHDLAEALLGLRTYSPADAHVATYADLLPPPVSRCDIQPLAQPAGTIDPPIGPDRLSTAFKNADLDGDLLLDDFERTIGLNPRAKSSQLDQVEDGLKLLYRLPLHTYLADGLKWEDIDWSHDTDDDGLPDSAEIYITQTNPKYFDSDGDGLPDGWEVLYGLNPLLADSDGNGVGDAYEDLDADGVSNLDEYINNANPLLTDSDGDGISDIVEILNGSNPGNGSDNGQTPGYTATLEITIGDPSSSESERWQLEIGDYKFTAPLGDVRTYTRVMPAGTYRVKLRHLGSREEEPDWDYIALIKKVGGRACVKIPTFNGLLGNFGDRPPTWPSFDMQILPFYGDITEVVGPKYICTNGSADYQVHVGNNPWTSVSWSVTSGGGLVGLSGGTGGAPLHLQANGNGGVVQLQAHVTQLSCPETMSIAFDARIIDPQFVPDEETHGPGASTVTILPTDRERVDVLMDDIAGVTATYKVLDPSIAKFVTGDDLSATASASAVSDGRRRLVLEGIKAGTTEIEVTLSGGTACKRFPVKVGGTLKVEYNRAPTYKYRRQYPEDTHDHDDPNSLAAGVVAVGSQMPPSGAIFAFPPPEPGELRIIPPGPQFGPNLPNAVVNQIYNSSAALDATWRITVLDALGQPKRSKPVALMFEKNIMYESGNIGVVPRETTDERGRVEFSLVANANRIKSMMIQETGGNALLEERLTGPENVSIVLGRSADLLPITVPVTPPTSAFASGQVFDKHTFTGHSLRYEGSLNKVDNTSGSKAAALSVRAAVLNHYQYTIFVHNLQQRQYQLNYHGTNHPYELDYESPPPVLPILQSSVIDPSILEVVPTTMSPTPSLFDALPDGTARFDDVLRPASAAWVSQWRENHQLHYPNMEVSNDLQAVDPDDPPPGGGQVYWDVAAALADFGLGFVPGWDLKDVIVEGFWKPVIKGEPTGWGYTIAGVSFVGLLADFGYLGGPVGLATNAITGAAKVIVKHVPPKLLKALWGLATNAADAVKVLLDYLHKFPRPQNFVPTSVAHWRAWAEDLITKTINGWRSILNAPLKSSYDNLSFAVGKVNAMSYRTLSDEALEGVAASGKYLGSSADNVITAASGRIRSAASGGAEIGDESIESVFEASRKTLADGVTHNVSSLPDPKNVQRVEEGLQAAGRQYDSNLRDKVTPYIGAGTDRPFKTMEEFEALRFQPASSLTAEQKQAINAIREAVPHPPKFARVMPIQAGNPYPVGGAADTLLQSSSATVYGSLASSDDLTGLGNLAAIRERLRLDYPGSGFDHDIPYAVLETPAAAFGQTAKIPRQQGFPNNSSQEYVLPSPKAYPFTGNGFISNREGRLVPEWSCGDTVMTAGTATGAPVTTMRFRYADGSPNVRTIDGVTASDWKLIVDPADANFRKWVPIE